MFHKHGTKVIKLFCDCQWQVHSTCDLYYKHFTIVNDASRVIRMTIVSDSTTWSIDDNHN
jgi:hypothetical protein